MGNCGGGGGEDKMTVKNTLQLLILGISGCGKTTFTKQMKIINSEGFQDFEVQNFRKIILRNISSGLHELLLRLKDAENKLKNRENEEAAAFIEDNPSFQLTPENIQMAKNLWDDKAIEEIWKEFKSSMHNAHLDYYIENIDRIAKDDYSPTNEDVVRCRQYTIGASTTTYFYGKNWWKLIDVGGQTPERAKWDSIMQEHDVHSVIYFVAMDEFDIPSESDGDMTKLELSLKVWNDTLGTGDFKESPIILFFNKMDIFEEKIQQKKQYKAFQKRFNDYEGEQDIEQVSNFIKDKFLNSAVDNGYDEEYIYPNFTCAIDTQKMDFAWKSIYESVVAKRMKTGGFE